MALASFLNIPLLAFQEDGVWKVIQDGKEVEYRGTIAQIKEKLTAPTIEGEGEEATITGYANRNLVSGLYDKTRNAFVDTYNQTKQNVNLTGVDESETTPLTFRLDQNHPNPFNPSTVIRFQIPEASHVTLSVYNIIGQEVTRLVESSLPAGVHSVIFDGSAHSSGVYFYRITTPAFTQTHKMMLIR